MNYYGQDLIDKWLIEHLDLPDKGVIVDVGAGPDGINMSNSKALEERGWTALCIEGDPRNKDIVKNRRLVELAVVSTKPEVTFFESTVSPDISGTIAYDDKVKPTKVKAVTLESLLEKHKIGKIDVLSIDTEGSEIDAFESMDWKKHKPHYLVIEFDTQGHVNINAEPYFKSLGYRPIAIHGPNMIFEYPEPIVKDPHLIVYGSSYDRGLDILLAMWPDIRKAVPDARLRVFYGWNLFDVGYHDNPERMAWKDKINELMQQPGITHLGRIPHAAVKREFDRAGVWAYPTYFGEISCITAMKAQASGTVPCVINYAALKETVKFGVKVDGDIYDQETKELYKNSLIALLNDPVYQEQVRKEMVPWARENFAWQNVAKQWSEEFKLPVVRTLDQQVEELLDDNQALKAWELVKDTDWPKKDRLWLRVKHAFNKEDYRKYYAEQLKESYISEVQALDCTTLYPRFKWIVESIEKQGAKSVVDLGCADGYACLTLANRGIKCYGVNLNRASVYVAEERAERLKLPASFHAGDLMDCTKKADAVILSEVLEHVPNPQEVIDHCMGLVNPGGSFYLTTPSPNHVGIRDHKEEQGRKENDWDDGLPAGHLRVFDEAELREMLGKYKVAQFLVDEQGCYLVEVKRDGK